jgi:hypothetical protein
MLWPLLALSARPEKLTNRPLLEQSKLTSSQGTQKNMFVNVGGEAACVAVVSEADGAASAAGAVPTAGAASAAVSASAAGAVSEVNFFLMSF